jgi:hypothetical protein
VTLPGLMHGAATKTGASTEHDRIYTDRRA